MATGYFAYGTNMSRAQMAVRCPGAALVRAAVLRDFRFRITSHGFATVVPEADAVVHGVLWLVTQEDERALDRFEGVPEALYRRERHQVSVRLGGDGGPSDPAQALVYVASDARPGRPRVGYLEQVLAGAESHGLPAEYLTELGRWRLPETGSR